MGRASGAQHGAAHGIRDAYRRCNSHRRELIAVYANEQMELSGMERRGEHVPFTSSED